MMAMMLIVVLVMMLVVMALVVLVLMVVMVITVMASMMVLVRYLDHVIKNLLIFIIGCPVGRMDSSKTSVSLFECKSFLLQVPRFAFFELYLGRQICFFLCDLVVLFGEGILESLIVVSFMFPMVILVWSHMHQLFLQVALMVKGFLVVVLVSFFVGWSMMGVDRLCRMMHCVCGLWLEVYILVRSFMLYRYRGVDRLCLMMHSVCGLWLDVNIFVRGFILYRHRLQDVLCFMSFTWI